MDEIRLYRLIYASVHTAPLCFRTIWHHVRAIARKMRWFDSGAGSVNGIVGTLSSGTTGACGTRLSVTPAGPACARGGVRGCPRYNLQLICSAGVAMHLKLVHSSTGCR